MLTLFFWLKYLRRRRIVLLSIAAVAVSVSLLIVVASLFGGFIDAFEQSAVEIIGDVVLFAPVAIRHYPAFLDRLEQTDIVEAATATLSSEGLLFVGKGNVRGVSIMGIEPARRARVTALKPALVRQKHLPGEPAFDVPGQPTKAGGFVGIGIVADPDDKTDEYDQDAVAEMIGQLVSATTGALRETPEAGAVPKRRVIPFHIADIVFTGVYDLDETFVYIPIATLQKKLYPDEEDPLATAINIRLRPNVDPVQGVAHIRGVWEVFAGQTLGWSPFLIDQTKVETARDMQHRYVVELRKQMSVLLLIFGVISFSVVVLVFCIFYMIVRLKQKDVAILRSCGAGRISVAWIFLGFGVTVGVVGSGLGTVLGYVITTNINVIEDWIRITFGLELWQSSVYMFNKIPSQVDWGSALSIVGASIAAAALGALLPAVLAARTKPVIILRYE